MRCIVFLAIYCLLLALPAFAGHRQSITPNDVRFFQAITVACPDLLPLAAKDDWAEELANPSISTSDSVDQFRQRIIVLNNSLLQIEDSINSGDVPGYVHMPDRFAAILELTFPLREILDNIDGRFEVVDLATTNDPAIQTLRSISDLPTPHGVIFIRTFTDTQHLPPTIAAAFSDDNTIGVTLPCRYIALLQHRGNGLEQMDIPYVVMQRTRSHELVHAYLNAVLGTQRIRNVPSWFQEGVAIYLSHSGGDYTTTGYSGGETVTQITSETPLYRDYRQVFDYLQQRFGQERLLSLIGKSVNDASADTLLFAAGVETYDELLQAEKTRRRNMNFGLSLLLLLPFGYHYLRKRARARRTAELEVLIDNRLVVTKPQPWTLNVRIPGFIRPVRCLLKHNDTTIGETIIQHPPVGCSWTCTPTILATTITVAINIENAWVERTIQMG